MVRNIVSASIEFPLSSQNRDRTDWISVIGFRKDPGSAMFSMQMWSGGVFATKVPLKAFQCDVVIQFVFIKERIEVAY